MVSHGDGADATGWEQRPWGERGEFALLPVARRLPRLTRHPQERPATAVSMDAFVSSPREGGWCAHSGSRRACAGRACLKCASGLPRVAAGCEGTARTLEHAGGASCWSRPAPRDDFSCEGDGGTEPLTSYKTCSVRQPVNLWSATMMSNSDGLCHLRSGCVPETGATVALRVRRSG